MNNQDQMIKVYEGCKLIPSTHKRFPGRVYGQILDKNGNLLVSSTLDFCVMRLKEIALLREKAGLDGDF